jgi:hypothetical protein
VKALAWLIGILIGVSFIIAIISGPKKHDAAQLSKIVNNPVAKGTKDEAAFVIKHCGLPDREFTEKAPGTTVRHLVYRRFNTELFFFRGTDMPKWGLGNAFVPGRDEDLTMDEANHRMPCAQGQLRSFLESR